MLQHLERILPIEKDKFDFRQEMFQTCRPFDDAVSQNNITNGFRSLGSDYEMIFNQENLIQDTFFVVKEFHKEKRETSLNRQQFEEFVLLLRQKLEYLAIFDLFDCIAKDDQISIEEWNLGVSNLRTLERDYFSPKDFHKIVGTKEIFGKDEFLIFCYSKQLITVSF